MSSSSFSHCITGLAPYLINIYLFEFSKAFVSRELSFTGYSLSVLCRFPNDGQFDNTVTLRSIVHMKVV